MRKTHVNRYKMGDYWYNCKRCGQDYYFSQTIKEERTGLRVCPKCYDPERPRERYPRPKPRSSFVTEISRNLGE